MGVEVRIFSASDSNASRSSTVTSAIGNFSFADHLALDSARPAILIGDFTSLPDCLAVLYADSTVARTFSLVRVLVQAKPRAPLTRTLTAIPDFLVNPAGSAIPFLNASRIPSFL